MEQPDIVRDAFSPASRPKIYLILASISLLLLAYASRQAYPVVVSFSDRFGLASQLPVAFWLGLAIIVLVSIIAFADTALKGDWLFVTLLVILGAFLFGARVFFAENAGDPTVYAPLGDVRNLIASRHVDILNPPALDFQSYYSWPAFHFLNAFILELTGADFGFAKYMPLYFLLAFILLTFGVGKRLGLAPRLSFLLAFLALTSWQVNFAGSYYPRMYSLILFLAIILVVFAPRRRTAETMIIVLIFGAGVILHGQLPIALLAGLTLLAFVRREILLWALLVIITSTWYFYQAPGALFIAISTLSIPLLNLFEIVDVERYLEPTYAAVWPIRFAKLGYLLVWFALSVAGGILVLTGRVPAARRRQAILLFVFTVGIGSSVYLGFGEQVYRTALFLLVPLAAMAVLTVFSYLGRKMAVGLAAATMTLFVVLFMPANYGNEAGWGQMLTSELRGAEFFATRVEPETAQIFITYALQPFYFYNPDLRGRIGFHDFFSTVQYFEVIGEQFDPPMTTPLAVLDRSSGLFEYVIISDQGTPLSSVGIDWRSWPQTEGGQAAWLIYDNGNFQLYDNAIPLQ